MSYGERFQLQQNSFKNKPFLANM